MGLDELVGVDEGVSLGKDEGMELCPLLGSKDGILYGYDVGSDEGFFDG